MVTTQTIMKKSSLNPGQVRFDAAFNMYNFRVITRSNKHFFSVRTKKIENRKSLKVMYRMYLSMMRNRKCLLYLKVLLDQIRFT